jgi:light-regulated signal transduction histidine kinase (bacteriophytochrome)
MLGLHDSPRELLIRTERENGDRVLMSVRDVGVGFDRQSVEKLFDAFYTAKSDGMRIRLSVSSSIVEIHHGRLWAEPNHGPSSTFLFSIPTRPLASGAHQQKSIMIGRRSPDAAVQYQGAIDACWLNEASSNGARIG